MTEQPILYVKDKYSRISFSAEEFRELEAAAKKRRLHVEEYLQMIVEENIKLEEEIWGKKEKTKLELLKQGDRLLKRLGNLERKYRGRGWTEDEYTWTCRYADKTGVFDKINSDLNFVHDRVQWFRAPDLTRKNWDDPEKNKLALAQQFYALFFPGMTFGEVRAAGLRSYKRLEEDFVKFRREVLDARDEIFEEKVLHV